MKKISIALIIAVFAAHNTAAQEVAGNVTLASDYVFRGVSQTNEDPAVQGGFDFTNKLFYVGIWGSNIDFGGPGSLEADVYLGITKEYSRGFSWDFGAIGYFYPSQTEIDYTEVYAGVGYNGLGLKLYYSDDFAGAEVAGTYLDASYEHSFNDRFSLVVGGGFSSFDGNILTDYYDYRIGVNFDLKYLSLSLLYTDTDLPSQDALAPLGDGRIVVSLSKEL